MKTFELDPTHFYTSPGLSWNAFEKCNGVKLEYLLDPDKLLMFEQGVRGGVSTITHRYSKANNKYLPKT